MASAHHPIRYMTEIWQTHGTVWSKQVNGKYKWQQSYTYTYKEKEMDPRGYGTTVPRTFNGVSEIWDFGICADYFRLHLQKIGGQERMDVSGNYLEYASV